MVVVGLHYGHAGQMTLDEITGGSPYRANDDHRRRWLATATANELQGARYQGRGVGAAASAIDERSGCSTRAFQVMTPDIRPRIELCDPSIQPSQSWYRLPSAREPGQANDRHHCTTRIHRRSRRRAAKSMGLDVSPAMLSIADEVTE